MKLVANILWLIFGGLIAAVLFCVAGLVCFVSIVGIPLGVQMFKFAKVAFGPFGKKVRLDYMEHPILNTLWVVLLGWETFLFLALASIVCCITVVGIPVGTQGFKFAKLAFAPFGADVK